MTRELSPLCVYCGASSGSRTLYADAARRLGGVMAAKGIGLVYGGGKVGLMGEVANAVLEGGGTVTGIITQALAKTEVAHDGLHDLRVVDTMHERKKAMADIAKGFVALPGGVGTLDEFFEIIAWSQLGIHDRPIGLLNVSMSARKRSGAGYFDHLLTFLDQATREGFLRVNLRKAIVIDDDPARLLARMGKYRVPTRQRWKRAARG